MPNINGYRRIVNLRLKIHEKSTCKSKKIFYIKMKIKHLLLWCHYKFISGPDDHHQMLHEKKIFGCSHGWLVGWLGFKPYQPL